MPSLLDLPQDLRTRLEGCLTPYGWRLVERSAQIALRLHADEVGAEHLLCALMEDCDCAAHRAVVFAFADPGTLGEEALAMAAGILVSGSAVSLPFSQGGVRALQAARAHASERDQESVRPSHLLAAALAALPEDLKQEVDEAGYDAGGLETGPSPVEPGEVAGAPPAGLFRTFGEGAKKVLSGAARLARQDRVETIGPAHLALACLQEGPDLGRACGLTASRARMLFRGRCEDPTPAEPRPLPADEAYQAFLAGLPETSGSLEILARLHGDPTPELARLLTRHRIGEALLKRAAAAFSDPEA